MVDDPAWIVAQIDALTRQQEAPRPEPWAVSDAPADFIAAQVASIVGVEIPLTRLEGKWKVSQNRTAADQAGVIAGLVAQGDPASRALADLVADRGAARPE